MQQQLIENISFIVVALNEEFAIGKCLSSIANMRLLNCEVICIDSGSKDRTLEIMKSFRNKFDDFRTFVINGYANSAIARNVGIKQATKEFIFFVDGDIQLNGAFIGSALARLKNGWNIVTGRLEEYQYSLGYKELIARLEDRLQLSGEKTVHIAGGTFIAKLEVIKCAHGFNERFERSQDLEFTLRIARQNKILVIDEFIGIHHTIPYYNLSRILHSLRRFHPAFLGMTMRRNIFFYEGLRELIVGNAGTLGGFLVLVIFFLGAGFLPLCKVLAGFATIIFLDISRAIIRKKHILYTLAIHYIYPFYILAGFVFDFNLSREYSIREVY